MLTEDMDGSSQLVRQPTDWWADRSGAFTLLFLQLGILYAWGVFQAELANQKLGNSVVLSTIGGVSGFCTALGCLPVRPGTLGKLKTGLSGCISIRSTHHRHGIGLDCCRIAFGFQFSDSKRCRLGTCPRHRLWLGMRTGIYCQSSWPGSC
jgi:hypothetical protein